MAKSRDLQIIQQIERKLGIKPKKLPKEKITGGILNNTGIGVGYAVNNSGKVMGLSLESHPIQPILELVKQLTSLQVVNLWDCHLTDASFLKGLTGLTHLYLSWNEEINDYAFLNELTGLTNLSLSGNNLSDVWFLKELTGLTQLDLGSNSLSDVSFLKELTGLTHLELWDNNLSDVSFLKELKGLNSLYLSDNNLSDVSFLKELDNLEYIDLDRNPITNPPPEIVKQGLSAIRDYLRSLEGEKKRSLNEIKILLVGDGGAGKTSLVKRLQGKKFDANESQTHGINIDYWQVEQAGETIRVRIWDFGGQEIMHATHQFFLSRRSLYVLVLDCRKDAKIEYWLKHIKTFGGDSPVIVVINKIDQNPSFDVNWIFLQDKYRNIKGFSRVSCATGEGIETFSQKLVEEMDGVELIRTTWAETWFRVKEQLENMKENFIGYDQYQAICKKERIVDKTARETLVDFLNDLGVILHFKDFKLKQTHVLEPEWVTGGVYKIINSRDLVEAKGLLKLDLLEHILKKRHEKDFLYPPEQHRYIIDLMQKFELCYEIDGDTILVPDLLDIPQPVFDFDYDTALRFQLEYDFLPRSVFPRFMVKMHRDVKEDLHWRTGVVLEDRTFKSSAVVIADVEARIIRIYVQGTGRRDYFAIILKTLRDIHNSFEKLEVVERVPLPDDPQITVRYDHLLTLESMGKSEFVPEGSRKEYKVKDLLGIVQIEKKSDEEILQILRSLKQRFDNEETLLKEARDFFQLQPNFMGIGVDLKRLPELIKRLFAKGKKQG